jgi:hypothetical protein
MPYFIPMLSILKIVILLNAVLFGFTPVAAQSFNAVETAEGIAISEGSSPVLFYQAKPKSMAGKYARANYIHPLYSLNGTVLTEDFPQDHPHHRGIFWAWHQILFKDQPIADAWSCENISWHVVDSNIRKQKKKITLSNEVLWKSVLPGGGEVSLINENSSVTIHRATDQYRLIDFDIKLAALQDDVKIGGSEDAKGYGGFSLRFRLPADIRFLSKDKEVKAQELAVEAGPWLHFTGSFENGSKSATGVIVFSHPLNPGHPQAWILRSKKSMQNAAFPGRVPVAVSKQGLRFQYRLLIYGENFSESDIEKLYQEYARL